jgi:hypothetical protein
MSGQQHAPAVLYPWERPGTHCTGGWVVLRAGLDRCGKSRPHWDSIPRPSSLKSVTIPTELPGPYIYIYIHIYVPVAKYAFYHESYLFILRIGNILFLFRYPNISLYLMKITITK